MSPDSITEKEITRSLHFDLAAKDEALSQSAFFREQLVHYLDQMFKDRDSYLTACESRTSTDCTYTIRKGGAVLTMITSFGQDISYKEQPPRRFYTFTATASHRNETLDNTDKVTDAIEWTCRITGGLLLGLITCVLLVLFLGHVSGPLIFLSFAGGGAIGGFIGQLIGRRIYAGMERRLEAKGEITAIDAEWTSLGETFGIVFDEAAPESLSS